MAARYHLATGVCRHSQDARRRKKELPLRMLVDVDGRATGEIEGQGIDALAWMLPSGLRDGNVHNSTMRALYALDGLSPT